MGKKNVQALEHHELAAYLEAPSDAMVSEFMHEMNQCVLSGIELTKLIVETLRNQNEKLSAEKILEIYENAIDKIGGSMSVLSKSL